MSKSESFQVLEEQQAYRRYLAVWHRKVRFPDGRVIDWDVGRPSAHEDVYAMGNACITAPPTAGYPPQRQPTFAVVMPFDSTTRTVTLVEEYAQGPNCLLYTFPAGAYEPGKHASLRESAEHELSEEAELAGGEWHALLEGDKRPEGISELKWGIGTFLPFLVIDPHRDAQPRERDAEEYMSIHREVSVDRLEDLIASGSVMLPSVQTAFMGLRRLRTMGLL